MAVSEGSGMARDTLLGRGLGRMGPGRQGCRKGLLGTSEALKFKFRVGEDYPGPRVPTCGAWVGRL